MTKVIIFDLDHTLARCNVSFAFGKYLYQKNSLSFAQMLSLVASYALHKCGLYSVETLHNRAFQSLFKNKNAGEIQAFVDDFLCIAYPTLLRPQLVRCLEESKANNAHIWLLSSSPEFLVKPIADRLGIDTVVASKYEVGSDGVYSHVSDVLTGSKKRAFLDDFLRRQIILAHDITAYSDSAQDIPLLEAVGNVIAVCPDSRLKKIALARNWQIWDEKN